MDHWNATGKMAVDQRGRDNLDRIDTAAIIARNASTRLGMAIWALQTDSDLLEAARLLSESVIMITDELESRADPSSGWGSTETGASALDGQSRREFDAPRLARQVDAFDCGLSIEALKEATDRELARASQVLRQMMRDEQQRKREHRSVPSGK